MLIGVFDGLRDEYLFSICEDFLGVYKWPRVGMFDGEKRSSKMLRDCPFNMSDYKGTVARDFWLLLTCKNYSTRG
jgi:hypothetical protein